MRGVLSIVYGHIENTKNDFVAWLLLLLLLLLPPLLLLLLPTPPPTSSARMSNERIPVEL